MLRTYEAKISLFGGKNSICDCYRSKQMPFRDKKKQRMLLTCSPLTGLPYNLNTMELTCQFRASYKKSIISIDQNEKRLTERMGKRHSSENKSDISVLRLPRFEGNQYVKILGFSKSSFCCGCPNEEKKTQNQFYRPSQRTFVFCRYNWPWRRVLKFVCLSFTLSPLLTLIFLGIICQNEEKTKQNRQSMMMRDQLSLEHPREQTLEDLNKPELQMKENFFIGFIKE